MFQSTHLYEMRPHTIAAQMPTLSFNPRTCTRCDPNIGTGRGALIVSIHAPVRDATLTSKDFRSFFVFQSTHLYEMRPLQAIPKTPMPKFQSTHLYEMRLYSTGLNMNRQCFNPRTCTRCDLWSLARQANYERFNPRTCTRCDPIHINILNNKSQNKQKCEPIIFFMFFCVYLLYKCHKILSNNK